MMKYLIPILALALLVSCRTTRKITAPVVVTDTVAAPVVVVDSAALDSAKHVAEAVQRIRDNRISFQTLSAKVKLNYEGNDKKFNDVNAFLRMKKDSVIWISLNAVLGIEAIRLMITPDTVKVMDKINKTIQYKDFLFLQEITKLPVDFSSLQDLLLGNPVFLDSNLVAYAAVENELSLTTIGTLFRNMSSFVLPDLLIRQSHLVDTDTVRNRSADLEYLNYEANGDRKFSTRRKIAILDKKRIDIDLEFRQVTFNNPVNFPFAVPDHYKLK